LTVLRSRWTLVALLVVGCGLMLPFEYWATRLAGMACLFGFIVLGVFLIADPRFLAGDRGEEGGELRSGSSAD
jgi:hypothetical protein